ncbi:jg19073 [Pararge aegeria aegeria]|uniref:Jg19073 protein n=1 Tax=Pararge aegeria aegeria TaxID=348720 RepID=A0A8S4SRR5_9NEOP|nr:jg19073 [Pararge aegeria aegeria]
MSTNGHQLLGMIFYRELQSLWSYAALVQQLCESIDVICPLRRGSSNATTTMLRNVVAVILLSISGTGALVGESDLEDVPITLLQYGTKDLGNEAAPYDHLMSPVHLVGGQPTLRLPVRGRQSSTLGPQLPSVLRAMCPPHCHFSFATRSAMSVTLDLITRDTLNIALAVAVMRPIVTEP